jgi:hypothetical protein
MVGSVFAALLALSCSGGGGGGGGGDTTLTPASLDQTSAAAVTVMAMSSGNISDFAQGFSDDIIRSAGPEAANPYPSLGAWALAKVREAIEAGEVVDESDASRYGSGDSGWLDCTDGGKIRVSGSWTGPNTTDLCEVSDAEFTIQLSNCTESGETMSGTITLGMAGNLCSPTGLSFGFADFSYSGSTIQMSSSDFEMEMTNLQWYGDDLTAVTTTMDGDISVMAFDMAFDHYVETLSVDGSVVTVTVNGSITGGCLDGWVSLSTVEPILIDIASDCPHAGHVEIAGAGDTVIDVIFNSDGSMEIGDRSYASCDDSSLPDACQ